MFSLGFLILFFFYIFFLLWYNIYVHSLLSFDKHMDFNHHPVKLYNIHMKIFY